MGLAKIVEGPINPDKAGYVVGCINADVAWVNV
jgi:hypothetical protein